MKNVGVPETPLASALATPGAAVQHLPRFHVVLVVDARAQPRGEQAQGLLGHRGIEREGLEGGDDAVAPEQRRVPRDAGRVVAPAVPAASEAMSGRGGLPSSHNSWPRR
jgi:hypothetical protein